MSKVSLKEAELIKSLAWVEVERRYWAFVGSRVDFGLEEGALDFFTDRLCAWQEKMEEAWGTRFITGGDGRPAIVSSGVLDRDTLLDPGFWASVPVEDWAMQDFMDWDEGEYLA